MMAWFFKFLGGDLADLGRDPLGMFTRLSRQSGGLVPLRIGLRQAYLASDPEKIRRVLLENVEGYDKGTPAFRAVRLALGNGLLTSGGPFWRRQRRIAQPAFHGENLKRFGPIFCRLAQSCADQWEKARQVGQLIDAGKDMMKVTLTGVAEALFGQDLSGQAEEIYRVFPVILEGLAHRTASPLPVPMWIPAERNRRLQAALGSMKSIVNGMIRSRREKLTEIAAAQERDLLSTLMLAKDEETGESMSDDQLQDEIMTILIAGHETTANALTWAWILLDQHPEEQERLRAEILQATAGRMPMVEDLPAFSRLRMVFLETLRLYPPVWMFDRRAIRPDQLGETKIRPGNLIIMCTYGIHRVPGLWRDPETFRPERFEPGHEEQKNKFAFLPFGAGPRMCMGMSFAMIESLIILSTLLCRFRVRVTEAEKIRPKPQVTLRPDRPVYLQVEPVSLGR